MGLHHEDLLKCTVCCGYGSILNSETLRINGAAKSSFVMEQDVIKKKKKETCKFMLVADIDLLCIFWSFASDMTQTVDFARVYVGMHARKLHRAYHPVSSRARHRGVTPGLVWQACGYIPFLTWALLFMFWGSYRSPFVNKKKEKKWQSETCQRMNECFYYIVIILFIDKCSYFIWILCVILE